MKIEHYQISKLLNDSTLSKFVTKKWIEEKRLTTIQGVNILLSMKI